MKNIIQTLLAWTIALFLGSLIVAFKFGSVPLMLASWAMLAISLMPFTLTCLGLFVLVRVVCLAVAPLIDRIKGNK